MSETEILDQNNLELAWPLAGLALVWAYLGATVGALASAPYLYGLVAGAVATATLLYLITSRTSVDLGYVPVGFAGLALFALGLRLAGGPGPFLFGTVFCGALTTLPLAVLAQSRAIPKLPGWLATLGAGLACLGVVAALFVLRGRVQEWPALSLTSLIGVPLFAALACFSFWNLICHVLLLAGRLVIHLVYRITYEGLEKVPKTGGFLACSNHVSYIDWLIMGVALERPYRIVGDHAYVSGWFRSFFVGGGGIPIASAREDPALLREGLRRIAEALKQGHAVGLHPEGFMTRTGHLQKIRPGVELMVASASVAVVPVFIDGMWGSFLSRKYGRKLGKGDWTFRRRVLVRFGAPIPPEGFTKELLEQRLVEIGATRESDLGLESRPKRVAPAKQAAEPPASGDAKSP